MSNTNRGSVRLWGLIMVVMTSLIACEPQVLKQERQFVREQVVGSDLIAHRVVGPEARPVHFVQSGKPDRPAIVLIHGTPGGWQHMARFLIEPDLLSRFQLISIDRSGWGQSAHRGATFKAQAEAIADVTQTLREEGAPKVFLVGHSLGASIAPRVAIDYPHQVDGLLLLAGTLSPELSSPRWYNQLAQYRVVQWFIGDALIQANREIDQLTLNVSEQADDYRAISVPVIIVQGEKDRLVNPLNAAYARATFNLDRTEIVTLKDQGHLFLFHKPQSVVQWMIALAEFPQ